KCQGRWSTADGPHIPASRTLCRSSSGTSLSWYFLMLRLVFMASRTSISITVVLSVCEPLYDGRYILFYRIRTGDVMRAEDLKKPCPECGAVDKDVSTVKYPQKKEKLKEAGIPEDQEIVGAIKCSNC